MALATEKRSSLHTVHRDLHAKFGPFGGWELPIYYSSILKEHEAVRTRVGLFDVSHLGHLELSGKETLANLQPLVTYDLTRVALRRACYTPMLNTQGGILDEMIIYRLPLSTQRRGQGEGERFRLVVNAANGEKVLTWLKEHMSREIVIDDLREKVGTLALQGPRAVALLSEVASGSGQQGAHLGSVADVPRYAIQEGKVAEQPALIARTGYTGEDGFELFLEIHLLELAWKALLEAGRPLGVQPVGLGARDTLRLEAGLPLGGNDLDETTTPLEAGLEWTVHWGKGPFIGREVLEQQREEGLKRRLVGFELEGAGIPRTGYPISRNGTPVGRVTSGTFSPTLRKAIGMGYVVPSAANPGTQIEIQIHGKSSGARIVQLPFYRRPKS